MPFFKKVSKEEKFNAKLAKALWVDDDQLSKYPHWERIFKVHDRIILIKEELKQIQQHDQEIEKRKPLFKTKNSHIELYFQYYKKELKNLSQNVGELQVVHGLKRSPFVWASVNNFENIYSKCLAIDQDVINPINNDIANIKSAIEEKEKVKIESEEKNKLMIKYIRLELEIKSLKNELTTKKHTNELRCIICFDDLAPTDNWGFLHVTPSATGYNSITGGNDYRTHAGYCFTCANQYTPGENCPMCRQIIRGVMPITSN